MNTNKPWKLKIYDYLKAKKWIYNPKPNHQDFKQAKVGWRQKVQRAGSFMAGMILPSISVFIAWGLWSSMFLYNSPTSHGWFQVPDLGKLVGPGIKYLLPILIAINAGKMVYGIRGSAIAAFLTLVIIIGTDTIWANPNYAHIIAINGKSLSGRAPNQIIGAMVVGPLSAYALKKIESLYIHRIKPGFEMLIKNFSLAIIAILIGLAMFYAWAWVMFGITWVLTAIINGFGQNKFIAPLMTIFTEPTRTIFLNNALNHGILSPIGFEQVATQQAAGIANAHSIFFMYGGNAGPGFGLLLAYVAWKKGMERTNALGSSLIQFVGGIHEVYYVYVIARPILILATIPGAFVSMLIISYANGGTQTVVSPGSIISVIATSPTGPLIGINIAGVLAGTLTTFGLTSVILFFDKKHAKNKPQVAVSFSDEGMKFTDVNSSEKPSTLKKNFEWKHVKKIVVACDAGMGSSALGAGLIRKWLKDEKINLVVTNSALKDLSTDADIIVTQTKFKTFAAAKNPSAYVYTINQYMNKKDYEPLINEIIKNFREMKNNE